MIVASMTNLQILARIESHTSTSNERTSMTPQLDMFQALESSTLHVRPPQVRLLFIKVNPNISLSSQDANRCIQAFGGAKSLMRLVKIMVASDGPLFVRSIRAREYINHEFLS